ncbi:hypothetical protein ONZ45_g12875 [Pleurotus djamor]|nr:hypothetical protein ONZ45_g12875 [Pleurotus djamor]
MPSTRVTRSSVLGKRRAEPTQQPSKASESQLATPDSTPNPKRPRTSLTMNDGDANKENIPPFKCDAVNDASVSPRAARALRRTSTEATLTSPSRSRSVRRHASTSSLVPATPDTVLQRTLATPPPTPPTSLLPIYARARALLRATSNNTATNIAGRDSERDIIQKFITGVSTSSLYISGSPGTGKTALVNTIIRDHEESDQLKVITINCMALNNVEALWAQLAEELDGNGKRKASERSKKVKGREAVEALLAARKTKCVLILDELDHIASCPESLTDIFSLPSSTNVRLIGIANTHTLTSSITGVSKDTNVQTLHFSPYTPAQLLEIVNARLRTLCEETPEGAAERKKFLPQPALVLLTKKVASLTGDVRSLFEVLRGAIDLAVAAISSQSNVTDDVNPLNVASPSVTPSHVLNAVKIHASAKATSSGVTSNNATSETVSKVQNMGLHARIVLISLIIASKRNEASIPITESPSSSNHSTPKSPVKRSHSLPTTLPASSSGIDSSMLFNLYSQILARSEDGLLSAVSRSEFTDLLGMLEGVGLVTSTGSSACLPITASPTKSGRRGFSRSASFGGMTKAKASSGEVKLVEGLRLDEILRGLGVNQNKEEMKDADDVDPREEEVRILWTRESSRIEKDIKTAELLRAKMAQPDAFDEAMED